MMEWGLRALGASGSWAARRPDRAVAVAAVRPGFWPCSAAVGGGATALRRSSRLRRSVDAGVRRGPLQRSIGAQQPVSWSPMRFRPGRCGLPAAWRFRRRTTTRRLKPPAGGAMGALRFATAAGQRHAGEAVGSGIRRCSRWACVSPLAPSTVVGWRRRRVPGTKPRGDEEIRANGAGS